MSGLHLWAPWPLCMWQLLWLLVQAAQPSELALDPVLLSSIPSGPTEPWPLDQQNPPPETSNALKEVKSLLLQQEDSALPTEAPEEVKHPPTLQEAPAQQAEATSTQAETSAQFPSQQEASARSTVSSEPLKPWSVHQGIPDQHPIPAENVESSTQWKSSLLPQVPLAGVEPSSVHQKGGAQPPKSSIDVVAQPSVHHEVTVSPLGSGEAQHPVLSHMNVKDVGLGVLVAPESTKEIELFVTGQEVSDHPPKSAEEVKAPTQQETPPRPPEKTDSSPLQQETTAQPTLDATALQQTTAPPKHPEVPLPHPETVQALQPALTESTVLPLDLEVLITQQPEPSETVPPKTEQSATTNICELCACSNGTLSCIGLGPTERLRRVPVPEPNSYKGTFSVLNLQGNSISYINKDTWKPYHFVAKLNLSGNNLRELHKDSFEGLMFLQYLNLGCNLITKVSFGTFRAWHGMKFLDKLILDRNPLTAVHDPYLFKLPALKYLDMGRTQVSLTTVVNILMMTPQLEKLILPSHLTCCLCQFRNNIETVAKTVKLHCDTECLKNTPCDEELLIEGPFMKVLPGRKDTSTELTIEPERASSDRNGESSSSLMRPPKALLSKQQEETVSKAERDADQWIKQRLEAQGEQEEEEPNELTKEVPGYGYNKNLIVAIIVTIVTIIFIVIFCLIVIYCRRTPSEESKEGSSRGFFPFFQHMRRSPEHKMEEGGFWKRQPLWLRDIYRPLSATQVENMAQELHDKDSATEDELFYKMLRGEFSVLKVAATDPAAKNLANEHMTLPPSEAPPQAP
ncbi:PREDICTED: leucine-rich repeat-containing protein 37A2-like isoform X2 [Myotis brandtii]|uniref:leucine-rich repeat-containing protein 37A2-like isoform X2 n=1 Tax=Myotis brandtii TaxID=109478 RepID=UPI0007047B98|nr:PREDICTED: leucine-rich repeat-containing protein 37A2-like isoform X2 [Myotis brandtii]